MSELRVPVPPRRNRRTTAAELLHADAAVATLRGRDDELASLALWCDSPQDFRVLPVVGRGGLGKTRLATELVRRRLEAGWTAGFLGHDRLNRAGWMPTGQTGSSLIVVDYAETVPWRELSELIRDIEHAPEMPSRVRLLLLARSAGTWWDALRYRHPRLLTPTTLLDLQPIDASIVARRTAFAEALDAYARAMSEIDPTVPWLELRESASAPEEGDWQLFDTPLLLQSHALITLLEQAAAHEPSGELSAARSVADVYRGLTLRGHRDAEVDLAIALLDQADILAARGSRTASMAAADEALSILHQRYISAPATRRVLAEAYLRVSALRAGLGLGREALEAAKESADLYEQLAMGSASEHRRDLAGALTVLSTRFAEYGQRDRALETAEDAAELCRRLAQDGSLAQQRDLARALTALSTRLMEHGRQHQALETAEEAAELYRRLDPDRADDQSTALRIALARLSARLGDTPRGARDDSAAAADSPWAREILEQLSVLDRRVRRWVQNSEANEVLDAAGGTSARQVVERVAESSAPRDGTVWQVAVQVIETVGWFYFSRFLAAPVAEEDAALDDAVATFAVIHRDAPDLVPEVLRPLLDHAADRDPSVKRPARTAVRAAKLLDRWARTDQLDDLSVAIDKLRAVTGGAILAGPDRARLLATLSSALVAWFGRTGDPSALSEAVSTGRAAVVSVPESHPERAGLLSNLGVALHQLFSVTGDNVVLREAAQVSRAAVDAGQQENDVGHAALLANLSGTLLTQFEVTGELTGLLEAIQVLRAAVLATAEDDPDRGGRLSGLGSALHMLYQRTGDLETLRESVEANRSAVATSQHSHLTRAGALSNLGIALRSLFERSGDPNALDESVAATRAAMDATPPDHPSRAMYLSNLGIALREVYDRTGDIGDISASVEASTAALTATPPRHPSRARYSSNLGSALRVLHEGTGNPGFLRNAVAAQREAVALTPADHPEQFRYLSELATSLDALFRETGDLEVLTEAVTVHRSALVAAPSEGPLRAAILTAFGNTLMVRLDRTGEQNALDQAVEIFRAAVAATQSDSPAYARRMAQLGTALGVRSRHNRSSADRDEAFGLWREAANAPIALPADRIDAARRWAQLAADQDLHTEAARAYKMAISLLPLYKWSDLPDSTAGDNQLSDLASLAGDAAAWSLTAQQPELAVELLEQGRSALWSELLHNVDEIDLLRQSDPALAARLDALRVSLDASHTGAAGIDGFASSSRRLRSHDRRDAAREFADLVDEIRGRPGFSAFLRIPSFRDLSAAAVGGPVAIINLSRHRCDCLAITPGNVRVIELPDLSLDQARTNALAFRRALTESNAHNLAERRAAQRTIGRILAWLWDSVTAPVLDSLGIGENPASTDSTGSTWMPRVWWYPTGPLASLPLHAASGGAEGELGTAVLDRVVSSYTVSLHALLLARRRSKDLAQWAGSEGRMLLVSDPEANPSSLPSSLAGEEGRAVEEAFPQSITKLTGARATREAVLSQLDGYSIAHLACHSHVDTGNVGASGLFLADGPLNVGTLSRLGVNRSGPRLVVLSACETALGGATLPDEAVTMASAMQLAGFRNVIATLWPDNDHSTATFTRLLYRGFEHNPLGEEGTMHIARVMHAVVSRMRSESLPVESWSAYVHSGP